MQADKQVRPPTVGHVRAHGQFGVSIRLAGKDDIKTGLLQLAAQLQPKR